jgi:IclR family transcriptional regulator, KDG regulon repressor
MENGLHSVEGLRDEDIGDTSGPRRESESSNLKSLFKIIDVLDCFSLSERELSVSEIARRTGMPKSTAHRIADSLRVAGFLDQNASRERYRLGLRLFEYGSTVLGSMELNRVANPFIEALTKRSGENVHLCVFNGSHMLLVKRAAKPTSKQNMLTITEESACYSTGVGKATLAFQPETTVRKVVEAGLIPFTPHTIIDEDGLRRELCSVKQRGYAIDDREHDLEVRCVAAPIRNANGRVFAAISISGQARRMTDERIEAFAPLVVDHAASISAQLGYSDI